jgi:aerobic-type carbon monoxide dehydrogenase small subunit (CoxS/CutS family)
MMEEQTKNPLLRVSRRGLLKGLGVGTAGAAVAAPAVKKRTAPPTAAPVKVAKGKVQITLKVNGATQKVTVEPRETVLDVLREHLDLTGAKKVCNHGSCGACTVQINGKPRYSCMTFAIDADGQSITTVEGITPKEGLSPVQASFVEKDALMCGFCTPGFVVSVTSLLEQNPNPTLEEVKRACAGNTCRCGTYPRVFEAALDAAQKMRKGV